jgi:alkylhydroperoxidase/carboxymuconolactone decarboxylase family protein YurZ
MDTWSKRQERKRRLNAAVLKSRTCVFPGLRELGKQVFRDGAISRKHKELMALAVAVSQNCFD